MLVGDRDAIRRIRAQCRDDRCRVGGVGNQENLVIADVVGDQVVNHATVRCAAQCVLRPAGADTAEVVGKRGVDELRGARTRHQCFTEMTDIEQSHRIPGGGVLGDGSHIGHRHQPAAEGRKRGATIAVATLQGPVKEIGRIGHRISHGKSP